MRYEMMISLFEMVDFDKMNKKQAQDYFDWYIEQSDYRISLLLNSIKEDGIDYSFDYSVESLIPLWEWFENKIEFRQLSVAEYESVVSKYPEWLRDSIDKTHLSWEEIAKAYDKVSDFFDGAGLSLKKEAENTFDKALSPRPYMSLPPIGGKGGGFSYSYGSVAVYQRMSLDTALASLVGLVFKVSQLMVADATDGDVADNN